MGLFGLFEKKTCSVCGGEIGLLGNRKLEDGNLCKNCAAKLSPWFSDRRSSTVEQIKRQLQYREENKAAVAAFHTTLSLGERTSLLVDEDARKFMVTSARDLAAANPDVLDFSMVTGATLDIDEDETEAKTENAEGRSVSYNPPRYEYSYDFHVVLRVNHPYFDEIRFRLNSSDVETTKSPVPAVRKPNPAMNPEYKKYQSMGQEIVELLSNGRRRVREEAAAANAPRQPKICQACGANAVPDASGCCPYCGSALT